MGNKKKNPTAVGVALEGANLHTAQYLWGV